MNISEKGIDFICRFEGFRAGPYPDPGTGGRPYTIGYGTTRYMNAVLVTMADAPITEELGKELLKNHVRLIVEPIINHLLPNRKQWEFDALCSLVYNIGAENFEKSTLVKRLLAGMTDEPMIYGGFGMWNRSGGKVMNGLVARRWDEACLFVGGDYGKAA